MFDFCLIGCFWDLSISLYIIVISFFSLLYNILSYEYTSIYLSILLLIGILGGFPFGLLQTVQSWIFSTSFGVHMCTFLLGLYPGVELLGHRIIKQVFKLSSPLFCTLNIFSFCWQQFLKPLCGLPWVRSLGERSGKIHFSAF